MSLDRKTMAAIHIAKKDHGLDDDTYRDLMERETGRRSAADLDAAGARRLLRVMDGLPLVPGVQKKPARAPRFDHRPIARKVVALWLMLWNLDEVKSRTDQSIDKFVERTTGKPTLKFCTNAEAGKVVEALKAWCARAGVEADTTHALLDPLRNLVNQQWLLLALPNDEPDRINIFWPRVLRRNVMAQTELQELANELGTEVRRLKLGRRHNEQPSQQQGNDNG